MFDVLLLGLPIFWFVLAILSIILFATIETDSTFTASVVILGFLIAAYFTGDLGRLIAAYGYTGLVYGFLGYLLLGALWSIGQWWFFLREAREAFDAGIDQFGHLNRPTRYFRSRNQFPPQVSRFKRLIMVWIILWPWSLMWRMINDPVTRLVTGIFHAISGFMQRMSDRAFSDIN